MLLVPAYIRLMTTEEYGIYTLFQSWEGIVLVFTTLNLAAYAFSNALIKNEDRKDWVTGNFLGLICTLTAGVCVIFLLLLDKWELLFGFSGKYIILMALDSAFTVIVDLWSARNRFEYRYRGIVAVTFFSSIATLAMGIGAVTLSGEKAFAAAASRAAVQGIISAGLAVSVWCKGKSFFDRGLWKYALCFNIPLVPHFLSTRVLQQADRIMIQKFCGTSQAGIYGFSYKLSEAMLIFNSAVLGSMIPWTYKKLKKQEYQDISDNAIATILLIGALNLMLILLSPEIVAILGTKEYMEAVYIIPPIAVSSILMYLFNMFANVTYYYEQNKLIMMASVTASLINVGLNWIFIPRFGYLAAGYTTLASYICLAIMHGIMYRYTLRMMKINERVYDLKKITLISLGLTGAGLGTALLYKGAVLRYLAVLVIVIGAVGAGKGVKGKII